MVESTWRSVGMTLALVAATGLAGTAEKAEDAFESLYGARYAEVVRTADKDDDLALAKELLAGAEKTEGSPELIAVLCQKAADLCEKLPEGARTAVAAMDYLVSNVPDQAEAAQERIIDIWDYRYPRAKDYEQKQIGQAYLEAIFSAAQLKADAGKLDEAVALASRAVRSAPLRAPDMKDRTRDVLKDLQQRQAMARKLAQLEAKVKADPQDAAAINALALVYVTDLDAPAKAAEILTVACDGKLRTYVPMAVKDVKEVPEPVCLEMGDWYRGLAAKPGVDKAAMLTRAKVYYDRYLSLHKAEDTNKAKAKLAVEQVNKELAKLDASGAVRRPVWGSRFDESEARKYISSAIIEFAKSRARLAPEEQLKVTAEKLSEANGAKINIRGYKLGKDGIISLNLAPNPGLVSLEPLYGLKLESIGLGGCPNVRDLNGLQGMPLTSLELGRGVGIVLQGDLRGLIGTKLRALSLCPGGPRERSLKSLNGIQGLPLEELTGVNMSRLSSLAELRGLPLKTLVLHYCARLGSDLTGLQSLGLKLKKLGLVECQNLVSLRGIESMPLEGLTLVNPAKLPPEAYEVLKRIPTLVALNTGDKVRDEEILAACRKLREKPK